MNTNDYQINLDKWQASSHPDLANSSPEDLFEADFVELYQRLHEDLWQRIIRVHGTLYTLDQLRQFPFDCIYPPDGMEFWRLVIENFLDIACLMLHGLATDTGSDVHNLRSFHNDIIKAPWLCQKKRDLLKQTLRERKFDQVVDDIAARVKRIRNNRIAHRLIDKQSGSPMDALTGVSFEEFRQLFDAAHCLFGALSFGSSYCTLSGDLMPSKVGGVPRRTCLDEVLEGVLRDSYFVNQPERRGQWWPVDRKHKDPEELQIMNDLRKRIGLPEA